MLEVRNANGQSPKDVAQAEGRVKEYSQIFAPELVYAWLCMRKLVSLGRATASHPFDLALELPEHIFDIILFYAYT